jgi:hypothetical protein
MCTTQTLTRRIAKGTFPEDQQWGFESLFDNNEVGVRYEIWDTSTLFQDAAGTTPVTAPGQPVGLVLDKSNNLVLGSERVVNGGFDADTNWTKGTGWTISGGVAVGTGVIPGVLGYLTNSGTVQPGTWYRVTYTVTRSAGGVSIELGGTAGVSRVASGTFTEILRSGAGTGISIIRRANDFTGTVDNISVRELAGNHASQATDASRPTYGVVPKGGRRNLVVNTAMLGATTGTPGTALTGWTRGNSGGSQEVIGESLRIEVVSARHTYSQTLSLLANTTYTFSIIANNITSTQPNQILSISALPSGSSLSGYSRNGEAVSNPNVGTTGEQDLSISITTGSTAGTCIFTFGVGTGSNVTHTSILSRPQVEIGTSRTNYQRVTTAFDITEQGVMRDELQPLPHRSAMFCTQGLIGQSLLLQTLFKRESMDLSRLIQTLVLFLIMSARSQTPRCVSVRRVERFSTANCIVR